MGVKGAAGLCSLGSLPSGNPPVLVELVSPVPKALASHPKAWVNTALGNQPVMKCLKYLLKAPVTPNFGRTGQFAHGLACALPTCLLL